MKGKRIGGLPIRIYSFPVPKVEKLQASKLLLFLRFNHTFTFTINYLLTKHFAVTKYSFQNSSRFINIFV